VSSDIEREGDNVLDLDRILEELKKERDRISKAIDELLKSTGFSPVSPKVTRRHGRRRGYGISASGRKRLSAAMKVRWAQRKKETKKKESDWPGPRRA
jgi:hypothetical protein